MDQSVTESIQMIAEELEIDIGSWSGKRELAFQLWKMAGVNAPARPWSPEYLHGVLKGSTAPSEIMKRAIQSLGAAIDGMDSDIAKARAVEVFVLGDVRPGTLIKGASIKCIYPPCKINFIPRDSRQRYHDKKCRAKDYKRIKTQ